MTENAEQGGDTPPTRGDAAVDRASATGDNPVDKSSRRVPLVLFDADCGFCTSSARAMTRPWLGADIEARSFQSQDLATLGLTVDKCAESLHVLADGDVFTGGAAIARVLRAGRWPWPILGTFLTLPGVRWITERGYRAVARNRQRLPGGTDSCEMPR